MCKSGTFTVCVSMFLPYLGVYRHYIQLCGGAKSVQLSQYEIGGISSLVIVSQHCAFWACASYIWRTMIRLVF